ncbi:MAG TPA: response regulator [Lysobacter sp.]|nr:response regulator [Lysobacter sp.]
MSEGIVGRTLLVVEDEPLLGMLLEDVLTDAGATVLGPAPTVERALELLDRDRVDAVILDVNLGGVRSDAVAARLEEMGVPFVYATAYGDNALAFGNQVPVLRKPYDVGDVMSALGRLLS